jgi:tetratricopeptide (TPR) repeat protein
VKRRPIILGLLLAGITLALYWPAHDFGLVYYDDPFFVTDTPAIQSGLNWHSFGWSFTSVLLANWHPVTTLSFVMDHQWFGANPGAEHAVNALFHAANAGLLFLLLSGLTRAPWRSLLVAALFAWHPLRVESVVWISERKDVLSGFFGLLALLCYVRYAQGRGAAKGERGAGRAERGPGNGGRESGSQPQGAGSKEQGAHFYWLAVGCFALGLMSKPMLVTWPFVLLLLDVWPLQRLFPAGLTTAASPAPPPLNRKPLLGALTRLVWEKWPFFLIAAGFSVLTYVVQKSHAAVVPLDALGWNYRLANALTSYLRYLGKFFWPTDLAVVYPYQRIDDWLQTGVIALVLAAVSGLCLMQVRRRPWLAVGWFWYLGTSLPIIGLVQIGETCMADRYTYLTLIGPVIALVWLIPEAWVRPLPSRILFGLGAAGVLSVLVFLTRSQIQYWRDTVSLFTHAIAVTGDNAGAEAGLGIGLEHEGRLSEALEHDRKALFLDPGDREYRRKVGQVLMQQKQWAEAAEAISSVLTLDANDLAAHEDLAAILPHLKRYAETRQHWEAAAQIAPDNTGVLNNLAWVLATCPEAAVRDGRRAVSLAERASELTGNKTTVILGTLAAAYAEAGRFDDAIATAQKACASASAHAEAGLLQRNQELLAVYQKHQPWHESDP